MNCKCATEGCDKKSTVTGKSPYCAKCRTHRWKAKNPLGYYFNNLRKRARQRGLDFLLTFEEYKELAISTGYDKFRGRTKGSLTIDRKDPTQGYHILNVRIITLSANCARVHYEGAKDNYYDEYFYIPSIS